MYCLMSALCLPSKPSSDIDLHVCVCVCMCVCVVCVESSTYLSTKARSIAPVTLEVVRIRTLGNRLMWSICVRSALTTLMASEGSLPDMADFLAEVRLSTCQALDVFYFHTTTRLALRAVDHQPHQWECRQKLLGHLSAPESWQTSSALAFHSTAVYKETRLWCCYACSWSHASWNCPMLAEIIQCLLKLSNASWNYPMLAEIIQC